MDTRRDRGRLRRLARGDVSALEELYDLHAKRLFGLALWLTRSREDAEEIVQTVMVKLAARGEDLLSIREPAAYLVTMARRQALDCLERRAGRRESPLDDVLFEEAGDDPERTGADRSSGPAREDALAVQAAIEQLPADQREAVYLHIYEGWSFREIGELSAVPTFTAASRYRLALARLRERLGRAIGGVR